MRHLSPWTFFVFCLGAAGCGPEVESNSSHTSGQSNNGPSNNGPSNNDNGLTNNGATNNVSPRPPLTAATWEALQVISPEGGVAPPTDSTNRFADDEGAISLGHYFFYEPRISGNGEVSCASCHKPELGFADDVSLPDGGITAPDAVPGRHTPTVLNAAYQDWYFWDGRVDTLWGQATMPYESAVEMGGSRLKLARFIYDNADVRQAYENVFGPLPARSEISPFPVDGRPIANPQNAAETAANDAWTSMAPEDQETINQIFANFGKSLAAFQMQLVSFDAPLDRFVAQVREKPDDPDSWDAISVSAQEGARLFVEVVSCMECHKGPLLSDGEFHNLGLEPVEWADPADPGRADGIPQARVNPFSSASPYSDDPEGNKAQLLQVYPVRRTDLGAFRTPSLRNVALTPPYMHAGNLADLRAVIEFYNEPPEDPPVVGTRSSELQPLRLTDKEIDHLVEFLQTLDGSPVDARYRTVPAGPKP